MSEYIPIYKYCELNSISPQTAYRWVREKKFLDKEVKIEEIKVQRIRIMKNAKPRLAR